MISARYSCPEWQDNSARGAEQFESTARAYRRAQEDSQGQIPSPDNVKHWHWLAFEAHVPLDYYAGNFRQQDERRPCLGVNVNVDGVGGTAFQFVTPAAAMIFEKLRRDLASFELGWDYRTPADRALSFAGIIASAIGDFIRVHPFVNGNGRTSRILWASLLLRHGFPPHFRIATRPEPPYGEAMHHAMTGNDVPLTLLVLRGLAN